MEEARQKKRQRREVISEEEYNNTLSTIIQRDFYSDLPQLQLKAALLARRESKDIAGAVQVRRTARKIQNHEEVLEELEAQEEADTENGVRKTARPLHRETLTGFHDRVTSEDNAEFQQLQQKEVEANRERLEALFQSSSNPQQLQLKANGEEEGDGHYPALACDEYNPPSSRKWSSEWEKPAARNGLFFVPTPATISNNGTDDIKLLQNGSESRSQNNRELMPPPSRNNNQTVVSSVPATKHALVEYIPKQSQQKRIEPSQTRFPTIQSSKILALRTTLSPGDHSMDSSYSTDASTDLEMDGRSLTVERRARERREEREKQSFVNMTPLLVPRNGSDAVEASPIITWGAVAGTPIVVSENNQEYGQTTEPSFSVAEESSREVAAKRAAVSLGKRANSMKRRKDDSRSILRGASSGKRDDSSFSPAAMSLLAKTSKQHNPSSARSAGSLGTALRPSYTPQRERSSSTSRPRDSATYRSTPRVAAGKSNRRGGERVQTNPAKPRLHNSQSRSITAGLLDP